MTGLVADASVAIKWFVPEVDSAAAERLLNAREGLAAPRFLAIEVASGVWKNWRKGLVDHAVLPVAAARLQTMVDTWYADGLLLDEAILLSLDLNHPIFDCLYLVLARRLKSRVITAGKRLLAVAPAGLAIALADWNS